LVAGGSLSTLSGTREPDAPSTPGAADRLGLSANMAARFNRNLISECWNASVTQAAQDWSFSSVPGETDDIVT
jgi:hypothetical protein